MQTRLQSLIESSADIGVGFAISMLVGLIVYPLYTQPFSAQDVFEITCIFTGVGLGRRYCTRRFFNWWHVKGRDCYRFARMSPLMVRNLGPVGAILKAWLWSGKRY